MPAQYPAALASTSQLPTSIADNTQAQANHIGYHNNVNLEVIAIEAELGIAPRGSYSNLKTRLQGTGPAYGGDALREAMFTMAGQTRTLKAQNFPLWYPQLTTVGESVMTSGRNEYMAIYWPGGVPTGIVWVTAVAGSYTDATPNSGFQLLGGGAAAPVTSATTTLTRITNSNTPAAPAAMWNTAVGQNNKAFAGSVPSLAAGIYYVNFFYVASAATTVPELAGITTTNADYWNEAGYGSPTGYPIFATKAADTALQSSVLISGLTTTAFNFHWCGLY